MSGATTGWNQSNASTAAWLEGARQLSEEGRLAWLLGRGLVQALESIDGQQGTKYNPSTVLTQLRDWVQMTPGNAAALQAHASHNGSRRENGADDKSKRIKRKEPVSTAPFSWQHASTRRLEDRAYPVVFIGAQQVRGVWCSLALGVDLQGNKYLLGGREDAQTITLLAELATRGLSADDGLLVVTDGSRRLDEAVDNHWRGQARVQHCLYRLRQDLLAHCPESEHTFIEQALHTASHQTPGEGRAALQALHQRLRPHYPGAAERLERSLNAALTVACLEISPLLRKYLQIQGMIRVAFDRGMEWGDKSGRGLHALFAGLNSWLQRTRRFYARHELPQLAERLRLVGEETRS